MDILGTTDLIQRQFEEILEVLKVVASNNRKGEFQNRMALDGVTENVKYEAEISSFSDHMVVSHPSDVAFALQSLLHIAIQIHGLVLERGLLIRGAITKGSLHHEGNVVLGEALNKAVFLEEKEAKYPRVIIDNTIISLCESDINSGLIVQDQIDKRYFVSYINHKLIRGFTDEVIINKAIVIKKVIENNIFDNDLNKKVKEKWEWLARKFNNYFMSSKTQEKYHMLKTIEPIKTLNYSVYKQLLNFFSKNYNKVKKIVRPQIMSDF